MQSHRRSMAILYNLVREGGLGSPNMSRTIILARIRLHQETPSHSNNVCHTDGAIARGLCTLDFFLVCLSFLNQMIPLPFFSTGLASVILFILCVFCFIFARKKEHDVESVV